ncbi:MAG: YCF48-related protein [Bacteroidetes bacterium]|nr:YCF48-related protein [Bacteroidota bacterium]MCL5738864.1 YCF48-related protein [Bacteroidota bacterium]
MFNPQQVFISICILCLTALNAQSQWVNQSPDTLLRAYRTVFMLDGQTGWIGGDYGAILKTTDGGGSWFVQRSTSSMFDDVSEIRFVDKSTGYCLASTNFASVLLTTSDGGDTWNVDSSLHNLTVDSLLSPSQLSVTKSGDSVLVSVYCWGYSGTPPVVHVAVYSSTDLGETWTLCKTPPTSDQNIYGVVFPSLLTELVLTKNSIYRTTDGGNSWQQDSINLNGNSFILTFRFLNPDTGYFAGPTDAYSNSSPLMTGWTYDGGKTWNIDSTKSLENLLVGVVLFTSRERGFAVKWNTGSIFETTDGGTAWSENKLSNNIPPQDINSADGQTIVAAGAGGEIIVSKDSGATWLDLTPPQKIQFTSVKYLSNDLVAAIGNDDGLFVSDDSCKTWTRHQMPSGLNVVIAFGDTLNCWIGDDSSRIYHSSDIGLTWAFQNEHNIPAPPLYGINFFNDSIGCAVGGTGFITATTDGGATWKSRTGNTSHNLYGVFVASPTKTWAVGDAGTIMTTSNGFDSWASQTSPTTVALRSVSFSDTLNGYILGDNGTILKTTDGGIKWSLSESPGSSLNAIKFVDANDGWVVGDSGKIFNTSNGGAKWVSQESGVAATLLSLDFLNSQNGIAVGNSGIVLTTKNGGSITGVERPGVALPMTTKLEQNYPNPFNPTTTIGYQLPLNNFVTLKIYDILGREIATLVNGRETAGMHTVTFDASKLPSGVYFYRLEAGAYHDTKKVLLLK